MVYDTEKVKEMRSQLLTNRRRNSTKKAGRLGGGGEVILENWKLEPSVKRHEEIGVNGGKSRRNW